jgi:hypothetical protein
MMAFGDAFSVPAFLRGTTKLLAELPVLAIDLNPQHDLAADHRILTEEGVYPRFKVLSHDIVDEQGRVTPMPDLRPFGDFQFIIYDTCQFFNFPVIRLRSCPDIPALKELEEWFDTQKEIPACSAVHSGLRQRLNHSVRQHDVAAFSVRKADFGERKQLFRRIFDQPGRNPDCVRTRT